MITRRRFWAGLVAVCLAPKALLARPKKLEFGFGIRVVDFDDAFSDTPESRERFHRVAEHMRLSVMHTAKLRRLTDCDAVTIEFKAVPS